MPRNLARHLKDVDHSRTAADDSVKFEIAHQALLKIVNPSPPIELFDKISDGFLQALAVERFGKIVISTVLDGLNSGFDRVKTRHENHINAGVKVQGLLEKRQPVHARHFQVT